VLPILEAIALTFPYRIRPHFLRFPPLKQRNHYVAECHEIAQKQRVDQSPGAYSDQHHQKEKDYRWR
jgi:hypothetical protein